MKRYILSLVILLFYASCQEQKSEKQSEINDNINTKISSIEGNDTIFLGLQFGMQYEEVHKYFQDLVIQGKLQLLPHKYFSDKGKIYTYNYNTESEARLKNAKATFKTYYINNELYKLRISVESEKESNFPLLKAQIIEDYILQYGSDYIVQEYTLNNSERCVWINGIRMIEISEGFNNNVLIIYTNLNALKEKEAAARQSLMREI